MLDAIDILVIDDDEITAELVGRALRPLPGRWRVHPARDGAEGLALLRAGTHGAQWAAREWGLPIVRRPYLVLLDLNMPRMDGFEFLEELRGDPAIADSVVFVLTTSSADADRTRAYQEQIAGYMTKSSVGPQFAQLARLLREYAATVQLPG